MKNMTTALMLVISLFVCCQAVLADLNDGWVADYPFSGNANDKSGNGNHGTVHGAILTTDRHGNAGKAYSFDGVNGYIEVPDSSSLDIKSAITIAAWVNINKFDTNMQVLQKDSTINHHAYAMPILSNIGESYSGCCNPRKFGLELFLNGTFKSGMWSNTQLKENTWYFLAATYNGNKVELYLDGTKDSTFSVSGTIETNNNPLRIGNFRGQNRDFLNGAIDDIRIYNRALSESEILELFNEDNDANCEKATYDSSTGRLHIFSVIVDGEQEYEVDLGPPYNIIDVNPKN